MDAKILILWENNVERLAFKNTVQRKVILISETWNDSKMKLCNAKASLFAPFTWYCLMFLLYYLIMFSWKMKYQY